MHPSLILLLGHCIHGSFAFAQEPLPIKFLYTAQDYQRINALAPQLQSPYVRYNSPLASWGNDLAANAERRLDAVVSMESKVHPKRALLVGGRPMRNFAGSYLSPYLEPPSPDSVSDYAKYHSYFTSLENEELMHYFPRNHRPEIAIQDEKRKKIANQQPIYMRDHAPLQQTEAESEQILESKPFKKKSLNKKSAGTLELSADGDRIEFQIQGHEGPKTYIFGFDTGDGKNRQFRLEERLKDGTVKGHYGYYDARGKLRAIKYLARPFEGYEEKHHDSNGLAYTETQTN